MSNVSEVLLLCCFGMGHYNPCSQLAKAILAMSEGTLITMVLPVHVAHLPHVLGDDHEFEPVIGSWSLRVLENGRIHQWIYCLDMDDVFKVPLWLMEKQDEWIPDVKGFYEKRSTKPDIIINDLMIHFDEDLAKYWSVPTYSFNPSPLTINLLLDPLLALAKHRCDHSAPQAGSGEAPLVPGPIPFELPGFKGLEVDLVRETVVNHNSGEDPQMLVKVLTTFSRAIGRRDGCIANDLEGLYTPEALSRCTLGNPNYKLHIVGPLALNFDKRMTEPVTGNDPVLGWLDSQGANSVIFVSMGSTFDIPHESLMEFAAALEMTGRPVLWAHRPVQREAAEGADVDGLPLGWKEKNAEKIKVCNWVNQVMVLKHPAIGLFVTHSGWNGLMEGLAIGHTPLLLLPVAAEQPLNAKLMADYYQVGERLWSHPHFDEPLQRDKIVQQIESCLHNKTYRENQTRLHDLANQAWNPSTGSSYLALKSLLGS